MLAFPFEPLPVAQLRDRYQAVKDRIFDGEELRLGLAFGPGELREHVFDFEDGWRLIIGKERRARDGKIFEQVSASFAPPIAGRQHPERWVGEDKLMTAGMQVARHWHELSGVVNIGLQMTGMDKTRFVLYFVVRAVTDDERRRLTLWKATQPGGGQ